ncbi:MULTISPECIES: ABC transporter permease [Pseudonocardia]|uniref:ABC transporter permease n=2 Tax=Pseudonocardia TaxID=1847 RepID=A0ABQ0RVW8_9PSEU|nr:MULTISPECIES: ABC transporter permease [Pseudonocardia]OSY40811.1 putative aliphatic sulfonates transport permease protein SsuC [Pseudonocardia autotrophica]TDN71881.1 NitT/TauT family transport system permease protein [Pseudonocardia autotrophica]BBG02569.1 ABC transporter permease [Pseudonocardia autotrophica]GEC24628.1 ABC transporter permease [Pseudonocardia saturnea]
MARLLRATLMPLAQLGLVVALIGIWAWGSVSGWLDDFSFGSPWDTGAQLSAWLQDGTLLEGAVATLQVLLIGWAIGMAVGVVVGTVLGLSSFANRVAGPYLAFFNGMPRLILYPFLAIWLGFDLTSKVTMVAMVISVPVILTVSSGFREVDADLLANVRLLGAGMPQTIRDVYGPSLAIWVVSTARVTLGYAFQAAIAAEFVGASVGLGYLTVLGQERLDVNQIWAALVAVVIIAWALDGLVSAADRRLLRWMPARG